MGLGRTRWVEVDAYFSSVPSAQYSLSDGFLGVNP